MVYSVDANLRTNWPYPRKTKRIQGKKRLTNDYFHEIKPMLVMLRILGRLPCNFTTKGLDDFKWNEPVVLYSITMYILQSCLSVHFITASFKSLEDTGEYSFWISMVFGASHNLLVPITFWAETRNVKRYINLWHNFKDEYYFTMKKHWRPHFRRLIRIVSWTTMPVTFLLAVLNILYVCQLPLYNLLFALLTSGAIISSFCLWLVTCWEIRILSEEISSKMTQINVCGKEAGELRRLWLKLVIISTELGNTLAGNKLFFTISTFVSLTAGVFGIIAKIYQASGTNSPVMVIVSIMDMFTVGMWFIFIDQVYRTADSIQLILRLNDLLKPTIKVKGFYKNDRHHIAMNMKSAIAYLILLLQSVKLSKKVIKSSLVNVTHT